MTNEMMQSLALAGGYMAIVCGAVGSSIGCGLAGSAAVGAWKKCYQQDKPAPYLMLALAGAPLSQTIYGLLLLIFIKGAALDNPANWVTYLTVGVFGGVALMFSAILQGRVGASACNAFGETGKGFANYMMVLGVIETCAIFALVFSLLAFSIK